MSTEQDQFLKDLVTDNRVDVFEQPLTPDPEKEQDTVVEDKEVLPEPKNRHERRLEKALQEEREAARFLAGKIEARSEAQRVVTEESDYLKAIERIYGNDTPEAQLATDLLKKAIVGARDDAKTQAIAELREERQREAQETQDAEQELDTFIEDIEDTYNVTLTEAQQKSYFTLLGRMSPKDSNGNVKEYADPHAVWEVFEDRLNKRGTDNRAKDLSARSMVQSGAASSGTTEDPNLQFLKEHGLI